jgi:DNA-binding response OmpR family regulator
VKATVLLIDEAQLERKINEWTLTHAGYDVVSATSTEQAMRLVRDKTPDVIVVDALLPDIHGQSFLAELKRDSANSGIPVIILVGGPAVKAERFKREGAAEILEKEKALTDSSFLLDTVERLLHPVL